MSSGHRANPKTLVPSVGRSAGSGQDDLTLKPSLETVEAQLLENALVGLGDRLGRSLSVGDGLCVNDGHGGVWAALFPVHGAGGLLPPEDPVRVKASDCDVIPQYTGATGALAHWSVGHKILG